MKRMGLLPIALAMVVSVGCDSTHRDATKPASAPAAVGTAGESDRNKVSSGDTDFVKDLAIAGMAEKRRLAAANVPSEATRRRSRS